VAVFADKLHHGEPWFAVCVQDVLCPGTSSPTTSSAGHALRQVGRRSSEAEPRLDQRSAGVAD
jgi:hypothetical protein